VQPGIGYLRARGAHRSFSRRSTPPTSAKISRCDYVILGNHLHLLVERTTRLRSLADAGARHSPRDRLNRLQNRRGGVFVAVPRTRSDRGAKWRRAAYIKRNYRRHTREYLPPPGGPARRRLKPPRTWLLRNAAGPARMKTALHGSYRDPRGRLRAGSARIARQLHRDLLHGELPSDSTACGNLAVDYHMHSRRRACDLQQPRHCTSGGLYLAPLDGRLRALPVGGSKSALAGLAAWDPTLRSEPAGQAECAGSNAHQSNRRVIIRRASVPETCGNS